MHLPIEKFGSTHDREHTERTSVEGASSEKQINEENIEDSPSFATLPKLMTQPSNHIQSIQLGLTSTLTQTGPRRLGGGANEKYASAFSKHEAKTISAMGNNPSPTTIKQS